MTNLYDTGGPLPEGNVQIRTMNRSDVAAVLLEGMELLRIAKELLAKTKPFMDAIVASGVLEPVAPLEQECARATRAYFDRYRLDPTFFRASIEE